ncbi:MAG TPA: plastocyanin, partial [Albitalea sp.]|nr:plastocyanin [Albitalea sp.]
MKSIHPIRLLAAAATLAAGAALAHGGAEHGAHHKFDASKVEETAFGREGDPAKVTRTIRIAMNDAMRFTPGEVAIKRGQTVRFVVHNEGKVLHEMVLGTPKELEEHAALMKKFPEMEHSDPNMTHVKPGASGQIVWQFTKAGE